jgi:hypothetical protein
LPTPISAACWRFVDGERVGQVTRPTLKTDAESVLKALERGGERDQPDQGSAALTK